MEMHTAKHNYGFLLSCMIISWRAAHYNHVLHRLVQILVLRQDCDMDYYAYILPFALHTVACPIVQVAVSIATCYTHPPQ